MAANSTNGQLVWTFYFDIRPLLVTALIFGLTILIGVQRTLACETFIVVRITHAHIYIIALFCIYPDKSTSCLIYTRKARGICLVIIKINLFWISSMTWYNFSGSNAKTPKKALASQSHSQHCGASPYGLPIKQVVLDCPILGPLRLTDKDDIGPWDRREEGTKIFWLKKKQGM